MKLLLLPIILFILVNMFAFTAPAAVWQITTTAPRCSTRKETLTRWLTFLVLTTALLVGISSGSLADAADLIAYPALDTLGRQQIFTIYTDGTGRQQLTTGTERAVPSWSPDGTKFAAAEFEWDTICMCYSMGVVVHNADGSNRQLLASEGTFPSWSSTDKIAFHANRDATGFNIWTMNSDGTNQRQITSHPAGIEYFGPSWSPDGTKIMFVVSGPDQPDGKVHRRLVRMNLDGSNPVQLTSPGYVNIDCSGAYVNDAVDATGRSWSVDGWIVFWAGIRNTYGQVWRVREDGTGREPLTCDGNNDDPMFSSDGTRVSFSTTRNGGIPEMWLMNADGSGQTKLTEIGLHAVGGWASWKPKPGGILTVFGTRGTVTPTTPMYGSFVLANTSVIYIAALGQSLKTLGYTQNPLDLPNVRVYDASGKDVLQNASGGVTVSGCAGSSTVANYYATNRGGPLNANDTCLSKTLDAGVYTFTINPNTSSSSGELLFEVTVNPETVYPGGVLTVFGTRGTVTPTTPMYGSFVLANTSVMYIAALGQSLKTLGYTQNPLDLPNVRVYDASGKDVLFNASGGVTVSGCPSSSTVANYYANIRGGALNVNDTCLSKTLDAGVYTFTINPNNSSSSGELLFEVTVNPGSFGSPPAPSVK